MILKPLFLSLFELKLPTCPQCKSKHKHEVVTTFILSVKDNLIVSSKIKVKNKINTKKKNQLQIAPDVLRVICKKSC